jgi:hypothetical protein
VKKIKSAQFIGGYFCNIFNYEVFQICVTQEVQGSVENAEYGVGVNQSLNSIFSYNIFLLWSFSANTMQKRRFIYIPHSQSKKDK